MRLLFVILFCWIGASCRTDKCLFPHDPGFICLIHAASEESLEKFRTKAAELLAKEDVNSSFERDANRTPIFEVRRDEVLVDFVMKAKNPAASQQRLVRVFSFHRQTGEFISNSTVSTSH